MNIKKFYCRDYHKFVNMFLQQYDLHLSPTALNILCVLERTLPKNLFDALLSQLDQIISRKMPIVLEDMHIIEAAKRLFQDIHRRSVSVQKRRVGILDKLLFSSEKTKVSPRAPQEEKKQASIDIPISKPQEVLPNTKALPLETKETSIPPKPLKNIPPSKPDAKIADATKKINISSPKKVEPSPVNTLTNKVPIKTEVTPTPPVSESHKHKLNSLVQQTSEAKIGRPPEAPKVLKYVDWYEVKDDPDLFRSYFLSRFEKLRNILISHGVGSIISSQELRPGKLEDTYIVVMVQERRTTKDERLGIIVGDDEFGSITIFISFERYPDLREKFFRIMNDTVVAFRIERVLDSKRIYANDIVFPDVSRPKKRNHSSRSLNVLVASDFHVGSKMFMSKRMENFIAFLNGEFDEPLASLADSIEYIIVTGDLVDGVGVYPQQANELSIVDQKKQYDVLAEYLSRIPDDKLIIAIPGNHDVSTRLLPQPPFDEKIAKAIYDLPNIMILSNPATIELQGVKILLYHGQGFEQIAGMLGLQLSHADKVIGELLRYRHLHPEWGKIAQAPLQEDPLVIDIEPDLVCAGHVHINSVGRYKGVGIIVSGAFEGLTSWQRDIGINPTVGYFNVIDLKTYEVLTLVADEKKVYISEARRI